MADENITRTVSELKRHLWSDDIHRFREMRGSELKSHKRVGSIAISDMEPQRQEVDGRLVKICLNCGKPVPPRNRKYCSIECSNEFFAKHNQHGMADLIFKREKGTCQKCGWKNPVFNVPHPKESGWVEGGVEAHRKAMIEYHKAYRDWTIAFEEWRKTAPKEREFVADHIIPIALGGTEFDPINIQLLCEVCNKTKTKEDMKKIVKKRQETKLIRLENKFEVEGFHHVFQNAMFIPLDVFLPSICS